MNNRTLQQILALGAVTGIRSMSGLAALTMTRAGAPRQVSGLALAAEMVADKTSLLGDRVDPLPLAGRAVLGAVVGAAVARRHAPGHVVSGMVVGAAAAFIAAHLAYQVRTRLPVPNVAAGLLEDGVVLLVGQRYGL